MKNKWVWIALALVVFIAVMFYGVDKAMCTHPCN